MSQVCMIPAMYSSTHISIANLYMNRLISIKSGLLKPCITCVLNDMNVMIQQENASAWMPGHSWQQEWNGPSILGVSLLYWSGFHTAPWWIWPRTHRACPHSVRRRSRPSQTSYGIPRSLLHCSSPASKNRSKSQESLFFT